jgi:polyhydroxyalkanoate synthase
MELGGRIVALSDIKIPVYNLASREDHIAPARSVFLGCKHFGGEVEYVMAGSGHIAGVVNPPALGKYQHWTNGPPVGDFDQWVAKATENPGSWWPHWQQWIEARDKRRVAARKPGEKTKTFGDAPGSYVKVRV